MISATLIDSFFGSTANQQSDFDTLSNTALGRGIDLYQKKDYAGAAKEFSRSVSLSPNSDYAGQAYEYLADSYLSQNNIAGAIKTFKNMIKNNPSDDSAHLSLGNIYFKNNQFKEAESEYAIAVRINPASAANQYALGQTYLVTDRYSQAVEKFKLAIQISPSDSEGHDALGQALRKLQRYPDAVTQFNKAISLDKKNADAYLNLGYTYADMQKMDNAATQVSALKNIDAEKSTELQTYIKHVSAPEFKTVYSTTGFQTSAGMHTVVATLDSKLQDPGASKDFTLSFMFSKEMDASSVQNPLNWQISKATGQNPGGAYDFGLSPSTDVSLPSAPYKVTYDKGAMLADITFRISQNSAGNGTIDLSHMVFKFNGIDAYGKAMNPAADEYSGVSQIV